MKNVEIYRIFSVYAIGQHEKNNCPRVLPRTGQCSGTGIIKVSFAVPVVVNDETHKFFPFGLVNLCQYTIVNHSFFLLLLLCFDNDYILWFGTLSICFSNDKNKRPKRAISTVQAQGYIRYRASDNKGHTQALTRSHGKTGLFLYSKELSRAALVSGSLYIEVYLCKHFLTWPQSCLSKLKSK